MATKKEEDFKEILDVVYKIADDSLSAVYILMLNCVWIGKRDLSLTKKQFKTLLKEALRAYKRNKSCNI